MVKNNEGHVKFTDAHKRLHKKDFLVLTNEFSVCKRQGLFFSEQCGYLIFLLFWERGISRFSGCRFQEF